MAVNVLAGLLKRIGNFDLQSFQDTFRQRLVLQKTIYLLEEGFNVNLGYNFTWYVHGPYSPDLAREAYQMVSQYDRLPKVSFVEASVESKFRRFVTLVEPYKNDALWLETAACILYQRQRGNLLPTICQLLNAKNPRVTEGYCKIVYSKLAEWQIVPSV